MMKKSVIMLSVIKEVYMAIWSPQWVGVIVKIQFASMGRQTKSMYRMKATPQQMITPIKILVAICSMRTVKMRR